MRNQPLNSIFTERDAGGVSLIDPPTAFRFYMLLVAFCGISVVVVGRVAWVQSQLQDRYLSALNTTSADYEVIPARDGRILSESSAVLAADVDQYSVQVHYRWLQDPADEAWVARRIRSRLTRVERRDADLVERTRQEVIDSRKRMWSHLMTVTNLSLPDFQAKQKSIQQKVTRISESVNRRHRNSAAGPGSGNTGTHETQNPSDGLLMRMATAVRSALTTSPGAGVAATIVVREEETFHEIVRDASFDVAARVHEQTHLLPGVRVIVGNRRTYPLTTTASHIVGARTLVRDDERNDRLPEGIQHHDWTARTGRFGVERSYDHRLQGIPGLRHVVRNRRMEIVESKIERQPVSGRDVVLTLDVDLQRHAEQLLAETLLDVPAHLLSRSDDDDGGSPQPVPTGGSIVVMDVTTGRLLVAASAPGFSLSLFTGSSDAEWNAVNEDRRHPFISRAIAMALPPGSVIKPVTAIAALESGGLNPDAPFHCQGFLTQPDEHRCLIYRLYGAGHDDITLTRALAQSCNVYFFSAATTMGFLPLREWCDRFRLGRECGIDLPFEQNGNVPGSRVIAIEDQRRLAREALGLAIGQSSLTVTPLQMARVMAAIANGGWLVTPHVVSADGMARTATDIDDRPQDLSRRRISGLTEGTLARIREGLRAVVQEPYGTGYKTVRLEEVAIAGKSGTAETGPDKAAHAWFVGYVPAEEPQYAFVVVLEHGGSGSRAAGPVTRELVRKMLDTGLVSVAKAGVEKEVGNQ
jgi:penicillin-binding protein 2